LTGSSNERVRGRALQALARLDARTAVPRLADGINDPHPWVREQAADYLGRCPPEVAIGPLLVALDDPTEAVRKAAAMALGRTRHVSAVGPLLARLNDPAIDVRGRAARALGRIGDQNSAKFLQRATRDPNPWVQSVAVWSLAQLDASLPIQILRPMLTTTAAHHRRTAVVVLSRMGDTYASRILRKGLTAPTLPIRRRWTGLFAHAQPDLLDCDLLSRNAGSAPPWMDPQAVINARHIRRMARLTKLAPSDVRNRYIWLAKTLPLQLADIETP